MDLSAGSPKTPVFPVLNPGPSAAPFIPLDILGLNPLPPAAHSLPLDLPKMPSDDSFHANLLDDDVGGDFGWRSTTANRVDDNSTSNMAISVSNCCTKLVSAKIGILKAIDRAEGRSPSLPRRIRTLLKRRCAELRRFYDTGSQISSGEANWANLFNKLWKANIHVLLNKCACSDPSLCIGRILTYVDSPSYSLYFSSDNEDSDGESDSDEPPTEKKIPPPRMATSVFC